MNIVAIVSDSLADLNLRIYLLTSVVFLVMAYVVLRAQDLKDGMGIVREDRVKGSSLFPPTVNWRVILAGTMCSGLGLVGLVIAYSFSPIDVLSGATTIASFDDLLVHLKVFMVVFIIFGLLATGLALKPLFREGRLN